jgi:hypothetical protein
MTEKKWPRWIERNEDINLREVAPNLYVGAEYATKHPPEGKKWELVVDWYGSSQQYPSRVRDTAKKLLAIPFLDGDVFPAGALDRMARRVQAARKRGPVLIHCGASATVGGVWSGYLVAKRGLSTTDALARGRAAGLKDGPMTDATERVFGEIEASSKPVVVSSAPVQ